MEGGGAAYGGGRDDAGRERDGESVCVCARERERESERESVCERERESKKRARERERESERARTIKKVDATDSDRAATSDRHRSTSEIGRVLTTPVSSEICGQDRASPVLTGRGCKTPILKQRVGPALSGTSGWPSSHEGTRHFQGSGFGRRKGTEAARKWLKRIINLIHLGGLVEGTETAAGTEREKTREREGESEVGEEREREGETERERKRENVCACSWLCVYVCVCMFLCMYVCWCVCVC